MARLVRRHARLQPPNGVGWRATVAAASREGRFSLVADSELLQAEDTLETFADRLVDRLSRVPGYVAAVTEQCEVGGTAAVRHAFDWDPALRPPLRQFLVAWTRDGRGFTASVATPRPVPDEVQAEIGRLLELEVTGGVVAAPDDAWAAARVAWQEVRSQF